MAQNRGNRGNQVRHVGFAERYVWRTQLLRDFLRVRFAGGTLGPFCRGITYAQCARSHARTHTQADECASDVLCSEVSLFCICVSSDNNRIRNCTVSIQWIKLQFNSPVQLVGKIMEQTRKCSSVVTSIGKINRRVIGIIAILLAIC